MYTVVFLYIYIYINDIRINIYFIKYEVYENILIVVISLLLFLFFMYIYKYINGFVSVKIWKFGTYTYIIVNKKIIIINKYVFETFRVVLLKIL